MSDLLEIGRMESILYVFCFGSTIPCFTPKGKQQYEQTMVPLLYLISQKVALRGLGKQFKHYAANKPKRTLLE